MEYIIIGIIIILILILAYKYMKPSNHEREMEQYMDVLFLYTDKEHPIADPNNKDETLSFCSNQVIAITKDEDIYILRYDHFNKKWFRIIGDEREYVNESFCWIYKPNILNYEEL